MNNIQMLNEGFNKKYLKEAEEEIKNQEETDEIEVGDLFLNGDETFKLLDIAMDEDGEVTVNAENEETGEEEEIEYAPVDLDDEEDEIIEEGIFGLGKKSPEQLKNERENALKQAFRSMKKTPEIYYNAPRKSFIINMSDLYGIDSYDDNVTTNVVRTAAKSVSADMKKLKGSCNLNTDKNGNFIFTCQFKESINRPTRKESFRKIYNEGFTPLTILKDPEGKMGSLSVVKSPSGKFYIEDENGSVAGPYDSYSDAVKYAHKFRPTFKDVGLYKESYKRRLKESYDGWEHVVRISLNILYHESDDIDEVLDDIEGMLDANMVGVIESDSYSMDGMYGKEIKSSGSDAHVEQIAYYIGLDDEDDVPDLVSEIEDIVIKSGMKVLDTGISNVDDQYDDGEYDDEFDESLREGAVGSAIGGAISSKFGLGNVGADVGDRAEEFLKDKFKRYAWENNMTPEEAAWELGKKGFEYGKVYGKKAAPYMKSAAHKAGQMAKSGASKLGSARQKLANRPKPNMSAIKNSAAGAVGRVANSAKRFGNDVKSAYNQGRNSALANESYLRESMRKYTKSQLADIVRKGWAEDISDYDFNQMDDFLMKHNLDKIGYSSGKYGINGGLLQDKDTGDWYAIVGRNSALFQAF